jgi:hypothetical protein
MDVLRKGVATLTLVRTGVASLCVLLVAALAAGGARGASVHCPAGAHTLRADSVARAAKVALARVSSAYRGYDTKGATVVSAAWASAAGPWGNEVGRQCGARAAARTVVVQLRFPRMAPSASLSQGVVDVSRFAHGYRIWAVVH